MLAACYAASIRGVLATGERAGKAPLRLGTPVDSSLPHEPDRDRAGADTGFGFNLDASVAIPARRREQRERVLRYMGRPPISDRRLQRLPDGRYALELRRPWSDGSTHVILSGTELCERLAALVPPQRVHQIRYCGVFAPRARLRPLVKALAEKHSGAAASRKKRGRHLVRDRHSEAPTAPACTHTRRRFLWAELLPRVHALDVTTCPKCGGTMRLIAVVTEADTIRRILASVGEPTAPPEISPPRPSPWTQHDLWDDAA